MDEDEDAEDFIGPVTRLLSNLSYQEKEKNMKKLIALFKDEEGATAVEYGIMIALIAAVIILAVQSLGTNTKQAFTDVNNAISPTVVSP